MKRLLRSRAARFLLPRLLGWYLYWTLRANRWTFEGDGHFAPHGAGASAVFGFWHEYLPLLPALAILRPRLPAWRPTPVYTLVSQHRDGQTIGAVVRRFGIEPVLGSSSRGGVSGLRQLLRLLEGSALVGITPDGPRGPRRQAAPGIVQLAALAGVPILPCAARTSRRVVLKSWDRMAIPLPFGRGVMVCGPPILVPRDTWRDSLPVVVEAMNAAAARADLLCARGR